MTDQRPFRNVFRDARGGWQAMVTSLALRRCQRVGKRVRLIGGPHIQNDGQIEIGDDFAFTSMPVRSHLVVHRGASLHIGDRVSFGSGCGVACHSRIEIGSDASFGAFVMILDSDYHVPGKPTERAEPLPIRIGRGVTIGSHVSILRGSVIGDGVVVEPGSVVSGEIPSEERVSGVPARSASRTSLVPVDAGATVESRLVLTAMGTFRMNRVPAVTDGPDQIPAWNSLAAIALLADLEAEFGITLNEEETMNVRQLVDLVPVISKAQARHAQRVKLRDAAPNVISL